MRTLHGVFALAVLLAAAGCGPHAAENAGEKIDDAAAKVSAEAKKAGAEIKENAKQAGDTLQDAADRDHK